MFLTPTCEQWIFGPAAIEKIFNGALMKSPVLLVQHICSEFHCCQLCRWMKATCQKCVCVCVNVYVFMYIKNIGWYCDWITSKASGSLLGSIGSHMQYAKNNHCYISFHYLCWVKWRLNPQLYVFPMLGPGLRMTMFIFTNIYFAVVTAFLLCNLCSPLLVCWEQTSVYTPCLTLIRHINRHIYPHSCRWHKLYSDEQV